MRREKSGTRKNGKNGSARHGTEMTGAEMVVQALADQGVEHVFGYPGGAVLPIYDEIIQQATRSNVACMAGPSPISVS